MKENIPLFAYCHIGCVGGKSLVKHLRCSYGMRHLDVKSASNTGVYSAKELQEDLKLTPWLNSISGHTVRPYGDWSHSPRPIRWYAIFRHPVSRMLSHYQQQIGHKNADYKNHNLVDWIEKYDRHNWQVKIIAGKVDVDLAFKILNNSFAGVGINERYEESLFLFRNQMGLAIEFADNKDPGPIPPEDPEIRKSIADQAAEAADFINSKLAPEIELYQRIKEEIFCRQVESYGGEEQLNLDLRAYLSRSTKAGKGFKFLLNRLQSKIHPATRR